MAKSELQQACEKLGITVTNQHSHIDWEDPKFPRDKWASTIHYKDKSATFEYFTGVGNRICAPRVKKEGATKWYDAARGAYAFSTKEAVEKNFLILKRVKKNGNWVNEGPSVADVIYSLASEAGAMTTTFDEWCSDFGYNNDSLGALNTYIACQRNGTKLVRVIGTKLLAELQRKEH